MMKSAIVGVETAAVYQRSQVDQLALEYSADLNKWVTFDFGSLLWHASRPPHPSSRLCLSWLFLDHGANPNALDPHRIEHHNTVR